jgi:EpsI family protein
MLLRALAQHPTMAAIRSSLIPFTIGLGGLALAAWGFAVLVALARFWGANAEYADRFLIVLASAWIARRNLMNRGNPRRSWLGLPLLCGGLLFAPPAFYLLAQTGPRIIILWWLTFSWVIGASGAVLFVLGWNYLRAVAFPLAFLFLALPIPERFERPLQSQLQIATTTVAEHGLRMFGAQVVGQGFELHLPSGNLEVVEACSGVRSVTALLAIAAFVAQVRGFGLFRGLILLALALPVIAAVNALRIMITGGLQEGFGTWIVVGTPHEILGTIMIFVGLLFVLGLSQFLKPRERPAEPTLPQMSESIEGSIQTLPIFSASRVNWLPASLLVLGLIGICLAFINGRGSVSRIEQAAPIDQLPMKIGDWEGEDIAIDPEIQRVLSYDRAIFRCYRNRIGQEIHVWVIFWQASTSIRGYHHPDVCLPNRGFEVIHKSTRTMDLADGAVIPITVRHFSRNRDRKWVSYWTQEGSRVWTDQDESVAHLARANFSWIPWIQGRLIQNSVEQSARMTVLIDTPILGKPERYEPVIDGFTLSLAKELYALCPWALPSGP